MSQSGSRSASHSPSNPPMTFVRNTPGYTLGTEVENSVEVFNYNTEPLYSQVVDSNFPAGSGGISIIPVLLDDGSNFKDWYRLLEGYLYTQGIPQVLDEVMPEQGPAAYTAHNAKISGVNKFNSPPKWSDQSRSGTSANQKKNNNKNNQNQNNQNQGGSSPKKGKKKGGKGKGKGKGKKKDTQKGGQQSHTAVLEPSEKPSEYQKRINAVNKQISSVFECEMAGPVNVHMSYHYPTGSTSAPNPFQNTYDLQQARLEERIAASRESRPERHISVQEWNNRRTVQLEEQVQQVDEAIASATTSISNTDSDGDEIPPLVYISDTPTEPDIMKKLSSQCHDERRHLIILCLRTKLTKVRILK
ncbi:hypothetical protein PM082_011370 [Marasmius tenuissimus]|nr:hypothetical protein PM082_011370 [Marasmius tenuissimus]